MNLRVVWEKKREYERLLAKVEELETLATKMTSNLTGLPKSANTKRNDDDAWAALIDYKASCEAQLLDYLNACRALEKELDSIRSDKIRTAMKYRFIDCKRIDQIAVAMRYDKRWVQRLLEKGERIYKEMYGDD